jgi:hypothetical protein
VRSHARIKYRSTHAEVRGSFLAPQKSWIHVFLPKFKAASATFLILARLAPIIENYPRDKRAGEYEHNHVCGS